ncbi:uncharacterized protein LOC107477123 [Arachis duranensis]|uniref:Uncharacterized protein LOC107477123 n=1 Tax=Arachis duranensis TaxID=130453 RepID=A0A6P4CJH2_ARADU|nr:uncharacterized protein LOC107477123 [Arachis duranensis]
MNSSSHNRSNSVPSAPHPLISQYEECFQRLKASEAASSSSTSSKLNGLHALYECTDKVLQLQTVQQELRHESCKNSVDELLEGSLMLLDTCATVKDVLLQSSESIQGLQSAIRRKRWGESALKSEGDKYLSLRKKAKKTIQNALESFRGFKKGFLISPISSNTQDEFVSMIRSLKEAELFTLIQLESLLSFVYGSKAKPKMSSWTVVSKFMQPKRVCCDSDQSNTNEFEKVDGDLQCLFQKHSSVVSVKNFQNSMENLELCIKGLDSGIEQLERQLIKTRVSLLNIYNY